jgi:hypothetical protein
MRLSFSLSSYAILGFIVLLIAAPAFALDLHQARSQGLVGELPTGYVEALSTQPGVVGVVSDVNSKRKAEYERIAVAKGQSVDVVAKVAAQEIITGLEPGSSYKGSDGSWKKR